MKKIADLTYSIEKSKFGTVKNWLDGIAFWREEGQTVIIKFGSKKFESYFI